MNESISFAPNSCVPKSTLSVPTLAFNFNNRHNLAFNVQFSSNVPPLFLIRERERENDAIAGRAKERIGCVNERFHFFFVSSASDERVNGFSFPSLLFFSASKRRKETASTGQLSYANKRGNVIGLSREGGGRNSRRNGTSGAWQPTIGGRCRDLRQIYVLAPDLSLAPRFYRTIPITRMLITSRV